MDLKRWLLVVAVIWLLLGGYLAYGQDAQQTGSITANGQTIALAITNRGGGVVQLVGSWTGTVQFEGTIDNVNWFAMPVSTIAASPSVVTSATANGRWSFAPAGYAAVRVRASAAITGSATVGIRASTASAGGSGGGGGAASNVDIFDSAGGTITAAGGSLQVTCTSGCSGGTTDTDDGSVATGQSTGLSLGLGYAYNGATWGRLTFGQATMANSLPVTVASNQSAIAVTAAQGTAANLNATVVGTGTFSVQCTSGCSGGTTDTDDGSLATGQVTGLSLGLSQVYDGAVWRRLTFGQAAMASSVPVVIASNQSAIPASQSGTWNIGTVTALTAISNALPAGTNNIGDVDVASIAAGNNNIGDVDVATVPTDPFGANADAASATGSISAKLRFIAATGIPITAFPDNEPINVQQLAGTTTDTNSGNKSAGTLRVVLATDQPTPTNPIKVDGSAVTQPVNLSQIEASSIVNGGLTGSLGVGGLSANNSIIAQRPLLGGNKSFADGTQPTAVTDGNLVQDIASTDGAQFVRLGGPVRWTCGLNSIAATLTQCQAAPGAGLRLYMTGVYVQTTTTTSGTYSIQTGTGSNCGTGTAALFPVSGTANRFNAPITTSAMAALPFWVPIAAPVNSAICLIGVATNTISVQMVGFTAP